MPRRITIVPHLSVKQLYCKYRQAKETVARSQYQILWLLASGKKTEEVAQTTGYSVQWIRELARRYNRSGIKELGDRRHNNPGGKPLVDDIQTAQLLQAIQQPAPDGGLWNGRKVAELMSDLLERPVSPQRGWEYLKAMEYRLRVPRPENQQADPQEQEVWKKNSPLRSKKYNKSTPIHKYSFGLKMNIELD